MSKETDDKQTSDVKKNPYTLKGFLNILQGKTSTKQVDDNKKR